MFEWRKRGLIFAPAADRPWRASHAALPLGFSLGRSLHRVFHASRDGLQRSHIGWVDVDLDAPAEIKGMAAEPALGPGPLGCFDDHGVYPGSIVEQDGRLLLFYIGWNRGARGPLFYSSIGLASSDDGGRTFVRESAAPLLARSEVDPCLVTSPCVRVESGRWRMWYVSGYRWDEVDGELRSYYHVKYAESDDGLTWRRDGHICIDHRGSERNIARPWVVRDHALWRMWYATSGGAGYRLGYAESNDGVEWQRLDDEVGICRSDEGWDSKAITYPWVTRLGERWYMLYNGNGYGREGFGLAVAAA